MTCDEVRTKLYDLLFGLLEEDDRRGVEAHLAGCDDCRAAHVVAARERELLRRWVVLPPPDGLAEATAAALGIRKGKERAMSEQPFETEAPWLGTRRFWDIAAAAAVLVAAAFLWQWRRIEAMRATPQEAIVYGQGELAPGLPAAWRVFVRNAARGEPISQARVRVRLVNAQGRVVWAGRTATGADGIAEVTPDVPGDLPEGNYTLKVEATSAQGESEVAQSVALKRSFRIMVSTDKPLYQPGQTIHIRSLALATADLRPAAGRDIVLEVRDANGNKVFKLPTRTSPFGIAAADFELADQVNTGDYTIAALMGDTASERSVRVERYALPKFKVELSTDRGYYRPGETLKGDLAATYTFGEPVANARVAIVASEFIERLQPFATAEGATDAQGRFHFEIKLKDHFVGQELRKGDAFVSLEATVTDPADHTQKKSLDLTVTSQPLRIELFPESGRLVLDVENYLYIVTAYPDGRPAKTRLTVGATREQLESSDVGIARVKITPTTPRLRLSVTAEDAAGVRAQIARELRVGEDSETLLLRTDKAVYRTGETAHITLLSADRTGRAFLDIVKDRRTALTKAIDISEGRGELAVDISPDLFGTLELHAYRIMADGGIVRDTRLIQVSRANALAITAELDKETYRPAEKALIRFLVTRHQGEPVQAALSLAGVDEAVFALADARPGLERIYFMLQEELLKPRYEICVHPPIAPAQAVEPPSRPELQEASVVLFSAAEAPNPPSRAASRPLREREERVAQERQQGRRSLLARLALTSLAVFVLVTLPLFGYAVLRGLRPLPPEGPAAVQPSGLDAPLKRLNLWWVLGIYLPAASALVCGILTGPVGLIAAVFVAIAALLVLCDIAGQVRSSAAAAGLPLLARTALFVPISYGFGILALIGLMAASHEARLVEGGVVGLALALLFGVALLVTGALAIARAATRARLSAGRWFALALGRPALAFLPSLTLVAALAVPTLARGRYTSRLGGEAVAMPSSRRLLSGPRGFDELNMPESEGIPIDLTADPDATPEVTRRAEGAPLKAPARIRRHFPETLLWRPELITDERGRAQLELGLADSITTWRLAMSAVSRDGELGDATKPIRVFQDFFVDIDLPAALTQHDVVSIPVAVYNYLDAPQTVRLDFEEAPWFALDDSPSKSLRIGPKEVTSVYFTIHAKAPGTHKLLVKAHGTQMADAVERVVRVEPDGKPVIQTVNGSLRDNVSREIAIPAEAIDGASDLIVKIYPGAFSQVVEGMESIFRMPYGCFEQTSSTTYPNILVLDYVRRTKQAKPELEVKALNYIGLGYQRLLSFEVKGGGFDWYGRPPADTVLSAYGLMQFADMARVRDVDPAVLTRTRDWLFAQQRPDGSWAPGRFHAAGGGQLQTTAYIAWAIAQATRAGEGAPARAVVGGASLPSGFDHTFELIAKGSAESQDPYTLALCSNALHAGGHPAAREAIERLHAMKQENDKLAWWASKGQGATFSMGQALDIETTALAAYALLAAQRHVDTAHKALAWLIAQKDPQGTWHSTQATVLAMRALLAGTGPASKVEGDTHVAITANGQLAKELTITPDTADVFRLISLRRLVRKGPNAIALETAGKGDIAFQIVATHYIPWPKAQQPREARELAIDLAYDKTSLKKDDTLTCRVTLSYNRPGTANMTIVDLGIPPGFELVPGAFEALVQQNVIERYAVAGRQVILYFRELRGGKPVAFSYQLRAKFPVRAKTPRSTAYQYYEPAVRDTVPPIELSIL